jgi:hypothetical protein
MNHEKSTPANPPYTPEAKSKNSDEKSLDGVEERAGLIGCGAYGLLGTSAGIAVGWSFLSKALLGIMGFCVGGLIGFTLLHFWLDDFVDNLKGRRIFKCLFNLIFLVSCAVGITFLGHSIFESLPLWTTLGIALSPIITWGTFSAFEYVFDDFL